MRERQPRRRAGLVGLLVALASPVVLSAVFMTSASALTSPKVLSLLDVTLQEQPIGGYAFQHPPVSGDQIGFVDGLYKWNGTKKGAQVGRLQALITFVTDFGPHSSRAPVALIDAQAYLPGGTVMIHGYVKINPGGPSRFTLPVVGGTGIYDNVRGYVNVRDLGNGENNRSNINFHLLP